MNCNVVFFVYFSKYKRFDSFELYNYFINFIFNVVKLLNFVFNYDYYVKKMRCI